MAIQPAGKAVLFVLAAGVLVGGMFLVKSTGALDKYIAPKGHQAGSGEIPKGAFKGAGAQSDVVKIGTVTWPGYAGGELYNGGFVPSTTSRYWTEQGIKVEFVNEDDVKASREAWRTDHVQIMWGTVDALPTEMNGLGQFKPRILFQADWSQGGDAIVAKGIIKSANDMVGKKIAFAEATPSHTFLLYALDAAGLNYSDIEPIIVNSAIEAAQAFRDGKCDLAVVWSPDDEDCVAKVPGAHILMSSKDAQNIIADCFFAKDEWVQANKEIVNKIVKGWMIGAAEINSQDASKHQAAEVLSVKLGGTSDTWYGMLGKVRVCTWGDNMRFFGLDQTWTGMTGEKLYTKMSKIYRMINYVRGDIPSWEQTAYTDAIQNLQGELGSDARSVAQGAKVYSAPTAQLATKAAVSSKPISITFTTGSAVLDDNAKQIIEFKFADIMNMSSNRIRIEGNTDNTGSPDGNRALSRQRAQSVAGYLSSKFNVNGNRFVIVGNGADRPVADNSTDMGRAKNRRTDFQLLSE